MQPIAKKGDIELPHIPNECVHNAHMFYIKCANLSERTALISYLKERNIQATFHYIPLHSAPAGRMFGRFHGKDEFTTRESERLVRLPMYFNLADEDRRAIVTAVSSFYHNR